MGLYLPSSATLELVAEEGGRDFVEAGWMLAQAGARLVSRHAHGRCLGIRVRELGVEGIPTRPRSQRLRGLEAITLVLIC